MSESLLAFGAHPDDIEFGAGGVIAREVQHGRTVHLVVCSRGEASSNGTPAEREAEGRRAAKLLGAGFAILELGGDGAVGDMPGAAVPLAELIRRHRPQIVLAPTPEPNQHPDHARLGRLVRDAARLARYGGLAALAGQAPHAIGALFFYAVTPDGEPRAEQPVLVDVSPVVPTWTQAMEAHVTQARTRDYVDLQLTRARVWGARAGVAHATPLWPSDPVVVPTLAPLARSARRF